VPLTPAHAAAVIPLCRWKKSFWVSPLVVGSMAPDFAYFVFAPHSWRHVGHTAWGLVLFCIPAGLAVLFVFHRLIKRRLVMLLSKSLRDRLWPYCGPFPLWPPRRLAWICWLILLGALTHVLWDSFTHEDGWALAGSPQMKTVLFTLAGQGLHPCGILQYGSSLLGTGLGAWWSWQWYRSAPAGRAPADSLFLRRARPAIATAMISCGLGVGIVCGLRYACRLPGTFSAHEFLEAAFITGADAFGLALLVAMALVDVRPGSAANEFPLLKNAAPLTAKGTTSAVERS
jgi:hypothetical protein